MLFTFISVFRPHSDLIWPPNLISHERTLDSANTPSLLHNYVFSFQRSQRNYLNSIRSIAKQAQNSWPLARLGWKGLWSSPTLNSHDSGGVIDVFFCCVKPWTSWGGVLRNVTIVVGVVVLEIQCCSYFVSQEDLGRRTLAPHLTWP